MGKAKKGVILYGVLNWGLGHATRSVPLIRALQQHGFEVVQASDGLALSFLQKTFPECESYALPAYNIRYAKGGNQLLKLGLQLPKIARASHKEHRMLAKLVKHYKPAGIVSDNRLGFYHKEVPSVYITHQLKLMLPALRHPISRLHHRFINRFDECWIPDFKKGNDLAGDMAHGLLPKILVRYIGPLSRFGPRDRKMAQTRFDVAVILSGPEPQRSLLEEKLLEQLKSQDGRFLLIRGTTTGKALSLNKNIEVVEMATADEVKEGIFSSEMVISRSGYSSIMDYCFLGNRALLVPTPGQPEQEYLARYQLSRGRFGYVSQEYLNLTEDLAKAKTYQGFAKAKFKGPDWASLFTLFEGKRKG